MKIERITEIETTDIQIGDRIRADHYTATCQETMPKGALFLLDQYLDEPMEMNRRNINWGGYAESDLRETLRSQEILDIFKDIRDYMVPFESGDLLRIPFAGEMFGAGLSNWVEPDGHEQWPIMQDRRNRSALRCGDYEWGWLQNKVKTYPTNFSYVCSNGLVYGFRASNPNGVRPVFLISSEPIPEVDDEKGIEVWFGNDKAGNAVGLME